MRSRSYSLSTIPENYTLSFAGVILQDDLEAREHIQSNLDSLMIFALTMLICCTVPLSYFSIWLVFADLVAIILISVYIYGLPELCCNDWDDDGTITVVSISDSCVSM